MKSKVFLHIGAPMSGSTYLREGLARHRRRLTRVGVLFPPSHLGHEGGHLHAVLDVLNLSSADHGPTAGAWDRLAETVRDWRRGTVVLSHELLADASQEQVERIVSSLGSAELHVVYAAGPLGRQVPLAWQRWVHNGGTAPYATYVQRIVARDGHRMSRVFWRSHDAADVLARWATYVPAERIHVVTVPAGGDAGGVLWDRFARTVGVDPRRFRVGAESDGLHGLVDTEVLRLLNIETQQSADPAAMARLARLLDGGTTPRPAFPPEHAEWLRAESDRLVTEVKNGGYDVVGDVTDLRAETAMLASEPDQVTPPLEDVLQAQTRLLARVTRLRGQGEGPAGLRRRVLRGAAVRVSRLRRR